MERLTTKLNVQRAINYARNYVVENAKSPRFETKKDLAWQTIAKQDLEDYSIDTIRYWLDFVYASEMVPVMVCDDCGSEVNTVLQFTIPIDECKSHLTRICSDCFAEMAKIMGYTNIPTKV